jgi:CO/xanthine dehydrogenase Mo-binding subunit
MTTVDAPHTAMGQRLPKVDGLERVTGKAAYGADIHLPGMLHGKLAHSPHAHAVIKRIDAAQALRLPGVAAVITAADFPEVSKDAAISGSSEYSIGAANLRRLWMAREKALFSGHPVAAVAATDPYIAEQAAALIKVEYEVLPWVKDLDDAIRPGATLIHEDLYTHTLGDLPKQPSNIAQHVEIGNGDLEATFHASDVVIENEYRTQRVHQGYIEPQASAAMVDPSGQVTVWTSIQGVHWARFDLASILNIPLGRLRVIPMEIGGAFGGKVYPTLEPLCILLSKKTGRPVKMVLSREEVLRMTGPTSGSIVKIKTGCTKDGRLTAFDAKIWMDSGAFPGSPVAGATLAGFSVYQWKAFHIDGYDVLTNKVRVQAYRGPGAPQACFAMEQQMEMMAAQIGMDPLAIRIKNISKEGDPMTHGRPHVKIGFTEVLERVQHHPAWTSPLQGPWRGRGMSCGMWMGGTGNSSAHLTVNADGSISVVVGSVDLTGTRTALAQIAADEFRIPIDKVHVTVGDTDQTGYTDTSGGSRITYSMGTAVHRACIEAVEKLKGVVAAQMKAPVADITYAEGVFRGTNGQALTFAQAAQTSMRRGEGPISSVGVARRLKHAPTFGAHVADVEVDPETGKVTLLNYTIFQDVGRAVNPTQVEGQMQGGAVQGIGWALFEDYVYDEKGHVRNASLLDYRMPTALDLPMIGAEIVEVPAGDGPFGVRGCGEVPIIPPISAIANAIANATGVRMTETPFTPERVFWALRKAGKIT